MLILIERIEETSKARYFQMPQCLSKVNYDVVSDPCREHLSKTRHVPSTSKLFSYIWRESIRRRTHVVFWFVINESCACLLCSDHSWPRRFSVCQSFEQNKQIKSKIRKIIKFYFQHSYMCMGYTAPTLNDMLDFDTWDVRTARSCLWPVAH